LIVAVGAILIVALSLPVSTSLTCRARKILYRKSVEYPRFCCHRDSSLHLTADKWEAMQKQLVTMRKQAKSMKKSLVETRQLIAQNERAVKAAEQGVKNCSR